MPGSKKGMTRAEQVEYMRNNQKDIVTLDHIVPRCMLSVHEIDNPEFLTTVCNACNSSKKHSDLKEWCIKKSFDFAAIVLEINRRIAMEV